MSAWAVKASAWLNVYGPIAWWSASLGGALIIVLLFWCTGKARYVWVMSSAATKWKEKVSSINPLDNIFTGLRIKISDFSPPLRNFLIRNKTFVDCELCGPGVVAFNGNSTLNNPHFQDCDFVKIKDTATISNALFFDNITITRGTLFNLTVLIPETLYNTIPTTGLNWLTKD
jgi:hypothetical protein